MKNFIIFFGITLLLSSCSQRNMPNELTIVKYKELKKPVNGYLLPPRKDNKLKYKESENVINNVFKNERYSKINYYDVLRVLGIKKITKNIRPIINNMDNMDIIVINSKKEQIRIKKILSRTGKVNGKNAPTFNMSKYKSGLREILDKI